MPVNELQFDLNHFSRSLSPSGARLAEEIHAIRRAGIRIIGAAKSQQTVEALLAQIDDRIAGDGRIKKSRSSVIGKLMTAEKKAMEKEVKSLTDAIKQYGVFISDLFQDFYVLLTILKHLREEGLHESQNPKERAIGTALLNESRQLASALQPKIVTMANMSQGVASAIGQLR